MSEHIRPTWAELSAQRWGPGLTDPTPGIVIDRPNPGHRLTVAEWWEAALDDYAVAEREAIRIEAAMALEFRKRIYPDWDEWWPGVDLRVPAPVVILAHNRMVAEGVTASDTTHQGELWQWRVTPQGEPSSEQA